MIKLVVILFSLFFQYEEPNHGPVVLVGGGKIPKEAIDWMKKQAPAGDLVVIAYQDEHKPIWENILGKVVFVTPEEFSKCSLDKIGSIYIDGGDQWKYLNRIDSKVLQNAHNRGIPILGTSAGAMIMGEHYFTAKENSITSEEAKENKNVCLDKGFLNIKCLQNSIIDSHYTERNRKERLIVFMEKSGAEIGYGIDEHTALCINAKETVVFGTGKVDIIRKNKLE